MNTPGLPLSLLEWVLTGPFMVTIFLLIFLNWEFFERPMEKYVSSGFENFIARFFSSLTFGFLGGLFLATVVKELFLRMYQGMVSYF